MEKARSSWCRCPVWWWSGAVREARDVWSHLAMPLHKLFTASGRFSPRGRQCGRKLFNPAVRDWEYHPRGTCFVVLLEDNEAEYCERMNVCETRLCFALLVPLFVRSCRNTSVSKRP